jgi:hypothetical protein
MLKTKVETTYLYNSNGLEKLIADIGYESDGIETSYKKFFDDNPGAIEAVQEWIAANLAEEVEDSEEDLEDPNYIPVDDDSE